MFKALIGAFRSTQAPHALYGAVVAQSRQTAFYAEMGVPDTVNGRFEMMCIHIYLLLRRLKREGPDHAEFSQDLFDIFLDDMEAGLREAGVGDVTVPKRIKKMSRIFYGQAKAWEELDLEDDTVSVTEKAGLLLPGLRRNIYPDEQTPPASLEGLAHYMASAYDQLQSLDIKTIKSGGSDVFPAVQMSEAP